jgi:hypothetical protein
LAGGWAGTVVGDHEVSDATFSPTHPWGCHRRQIPDRVAFEHIVAALVHGSGYEIIASRGCSERTIRRRVTDWAHRDLGQKLPAITLAAYDKIIGLERDDLAVDGRITKAPCGEDKAGPSPVDRRTGGLKRSVATDAGGVPPGIAAFVTLRCLIQQARHTYHWDGRPTTRRPK